MNSQESLQNRLSSAAAERDAGHAKLELQSSAIEGLKKQIAGLETDFDQYKQVTQYLVINGSVFAHLLCWNRHIQDLRDGEFDCKDLR